MSSLHDIKRFMFVGLNLNVININQSETLLKNVESAILKLINDGKGFDLLNELVNYAKLYSNQIKLATHSFTVSSVNSTIDCIALILAICSRYNKDEKFSHKVYSILNELSDTPIHLFAFNYYRRYLIETATQSIQPAQTSDQAAAKKPNVPKKIGRGLKKSLIKWYNEKNEMNLLRLLTQYKHSYDWSNKDIFKLIHMKPKSTGIDLIMKYVMFGYAKVKDEKPQSEIDTKLMEFINDYEKLKHAKNEDEVVELMKKHKFNFDHLPTRVKKFPQIWPVLLEQLNLKEFCQSLNVLFKKNLLNYDSPTEKYVIDHLLNKDSEDVKNLSPIYTCIGCQIYEQLTSLRLIKMFDQNSITSNPNTLNSQRAQNDRVKEALWNAFLISNDNHKSKDSSWLLKQKIAIIVDINTPMRNGHTDGITCLNPIDTSACIMIQLYYMMENKANLDIFAVTDKLNKMNMANAPNTEARPDLNSIELLFQGYASINNNPNEKIFELAKQNKSNYDAFIFLTASGSNEKLLTDEIQKYRNSQNLANSKLAFINLTGTKVNPEQINYDLEGSKLNLSLTGWSFDSFFILEAFLKNIF